MSPTLPGKDYLVQNCVSNHETHNLLNLIIYNLKTGRVQPNFVYKL